MKTYGILLLATDLFIQMNKRMAAKKKITEICLVQSFFILFLCFFSINWIPLFSCFRLTNLCEHIFFVTICMYAVSPISNKCKKNR